MSCAADVSCVLCRYASWLHAELAGWRGTPPVLVLCSDTPGEALRALHPCGVRTLVRSKGRRRTHITHWLTSSACAQEDALGADAHAELVAAFGGGDDGAAFADWFFLSRCDALAVSNSTFSFSAAMMAAAAAEERRPEQRFRAVRPDPAAQALLPFDPWDALPTLKRG